MLYVCIRRFVDKLCGGCLESERKSENWRKVKREMPLTYHSLSGPLKEPAVRHIHVTHVNTLTDQQRRSV